MLDDVGEQLAHIGQSWPQFGQTRTELAVVVKPAWANIGQKLANIDDGWPNLGPERPTHGQYQPVLTEAGQSLAEVRQSQPISGDAGEILAECSQVLANVGQIWATLGRSRLLDKFGDG